MAVYFVSNEMFENTYKIGYSNDVDMRISQLNTSVPSPFKKELIFEGGKELETKLHQRLDKYRVESGREFFTIDDNVLTQFVVDIVNEFPGKILYLDEKWKDALEDALELKELESNVYDGFYLTNRTPCEEVKIYLKDGRVLSYGDKDYHEVQLTSNAVWIYDGKYTHNSLTMFPLNEIEYIHFQYSQYACVNRERSEGEVRLNLPEELDMTRMDNRYGD